MKDLTTYIIAILLLMQNAYAQTPLLEWATAMGDGGSGLDVKVTDDGYVYVAGSFTETVDFDPGAGVYEMTSFGETDIFVQKLDTNGNFIWARQIGGPSYDGTTIPAPNFEYPTPIGLSINVDGFGNLITVGTFIDSIDCDPGIGTFYLTNSTQQAVFIQKMDTDGNFIWAKLASTSGSVASSSVLDMDGNILITGSFSGLVDFDPAPTETEELFGSNNDIYVQKLNTAGELVWIRGGGGPGGDRGRTVVLDGADNIIVTGSFSETVDFDFGPNTSELTTGAYAGLFCLKLDADGNFIWVRGFGSNGIGHVEALYCPVSIDDFDNIYLASEFAGTIDADPGTDTVLVSGNNLEAGFILKLSNSGTLTWVKVITDPDAGITSDIGFRDIRVVGDKLYLAGGFSGSMDFDPGANNVSLTTPYGDAFILKMDTSGSFQWVGMLESEINAGEVRSIGVFGNAVYATGYYLPGTIDDVDPGSDTVSLTGQSFILKWSEAESPVNIIQNQQDTYRKILAYPNPTDGLVWLDLGKVVAKAEVSVHSAVGKLIEQTSYGDTHLIPVMINEASGVYIIRVSSEHVTSVFRIVKN